MTIVLSDLHLGHVCARLDSATQIEQLVDGFEEIVLNGDSVEARCGGDAVRPHLDGLREVAMRTGADLTFLTGNHDPTVSDRHAVEFDGGRILVMHGDAVFPGISPWGRTAPAIARKHLAAVREAEARGPVGLYQRLEIARAASLETPVYSWMSSSAGKGTLWTILRRVLVPYKAWGIVKCWFEANQLTAGFCRRYAPEARVVIVGHTHRRGLWSRNGLTVVNLGGYLPGGGAYAVVVDRGFVRVHDVLAHKGNLQLGPVVAELGGGEVARTAKPVWRG